MGEKDTLPKCSRELIEGHGDAMMAKLLIFQEFLVTEVLFKGNLPVLRAVIPFRSLILYRPNKSHCSELDIGKLV